MKQGPEENTILEERLLPDQAPVLEAGHSFGSITDKISAIAKAAQTHLGLLQSARGSMPVVCLRLFSVYGPWEEPTQRIARSRGLAPSTPSTRPKTSTASSPRIRASPSTCAR